MKIFNHTLSPFDYFRMQTVLVLGAVSSITAYLYNLLTGYIDTDPVKVFIIGFIVGALVGVFEEFIFIKMFRKIRLMYMVLIRSFIYLLLVVILLTGLELSIAFLEDNPISSCFEIIKTDVFLYNFIFITIAIDFLVFFNQIGKLFGHNNLMVLWSGKYRYPVKEERIFMFLDLISSTEISNKLERIQYFNLINDFFHDLTIPVLRTSGHIYQYVGDEVVVTWRMKVGLKNNNCIYLFHLMQEEIHKNAEKYRKKYGLVPKFKAGVHCGEVITAEIGDLKTEVIHNGEVVNTAARIRSSCTRYKKDLLISKDLKDQLSFSDNFSTENIGKIELKGVPEPMELYAVEPTNKGKIFTEIIVKGKNGNG
ncbi:MAG: adenylate/guanylate cyclase domain-containing protein [Rhodothermaceae bacterium]